MLPWRLYYKKLIETYLEKTNNADRITSGIIIMLTCISIKPNNRILFRFCSCDGVDKYYANRSLALVMTELTLQLTGGNEANDRYIFFHILFPIYANSA